MRVWHSARLHALACAAWIVLGAGVAACQARGAQSGSGNAAASPPAGVDSTLITMDVGPCFGTCPVYNLRIAGNGVVRYEGLRFVTRMGEVIDTISADSVAALVREFERAGFWSMAEKYIYGEPVCGPYVTDVPTVVISISAGARSRRVEHDHGCRSAPDQLSALENRINSTVRVSRWTTGGVAGWP